MGSYGECSILPWSQAWFRLNPEANKFSPEINSGITNHSHEITGKIVEKTKSSESVVNQRISNSHPRTAPELKKNHGGWRYN